MAQILIDNHAYRAITSRKIKKTNTLPTHRLEDGATYSDHIAPDNPVFDFSLVLFPGEYERLDRLADEPRLFKVVTPEGAYDNCAIKSLTDTSNGSANTTTASLSIEVQRITQTQTVPAELDGISLESPNTAGLAAVAVVEDWEIQTVAQLKEYYLSKFPPMSRGAEEEKLDAMTLQELLDYLAETMEELELENATKAIEYAEEGRRQFLDIDPELFEYGSVYTKTFSFQFTGSDGIATSYYIDVRKEYDNLGEYSWLAQGLVGTILARPAGPAITSGLIKTGATVMPLEEHYHITVRRVKDDAIMYRGPMYDLTPFTLIDPGTQKTIATLQYSEFWAKIYIGGA